MNISEIKSQILSEYKYRIETHSHTSPVSRCSVLKPDELVRIYKDSGYDAVTVTNHYIAADCLRSSREEYNRAYLSDYYDALNEGEKLGIKVILGAELCFTTAPNDYLVYGVDAADFDQIYDLMGKDYTDFYSGFAGKCDRLFIQAHPFRDRMVPTDFNYLDGIEVFNMHINHNSRVAKAEKTALEHPELIALGGSDAHEPPSCANGGILTRVLPEDSKQLARIIKSRDFLMVIADKILL